MNLILKSPFIYFLLYLHIIKGNLYIDSSITYIDSSITYAKYEAFTKDGKAGLMTIDNMEGLDVQLDDGIAILTTNKIWHDWYGASLGQVPPTSTTNSYISFSEVDNIIFKIKSNDISSSEIKLFL